MIKMLLAIAFGASLASAQSQSTGIEPISPTELLKALPEAPKGWELKVSNSSNTLNGSQVCRAVRVFEYRAPKNTEQPPALVRVSITDTAKRGFELIQFEAAINDVYKKFSAFNQLNNGTGPTGSASAQSQKEDGNTSPSATDSQTQVTQEQASQQTQTRVSPVAPARPVTVEGHPGLYSKQNNVEQLRLLLGERFIIEIFQKDSKQTTPENWVSQIRLKMLQDSAANSEEVPLRETVVITEIDELNPEKNSKYVTSQSSKEEAKKFLAPKPEAIRNALKNSE